jgi:hypothetical protein
MMCKAVLVLVALLVSCQAGPGQAVPVVEQAPRIEVVQLSWRSGELPVGHPVAGAWKAGNTVVMRAVIRTDFAGIYEWWGEGQPTWPVEREPDWWAPLPERMQ